MSNVFEYSTKDLIHLTNSWSQDEPFELSQFDEELRKRWEAAMKNGVFRYDIDHITTRIIPGPKHYVAQLNLPRAKERRKPQDIRSINQPFNGSEFNFTWVDQKEVVFYLKRKNCQSALRKCETVEDGIHDGAQQVDSEDGFEAKQVMYNGMSDSQILSKTDCNRNAVIINVSPMEYGHVLLVPHIDACLTQMLTESSIQACLEMILLSKHRGFRIGFNSLCAFASVNHLHFHAYYLEHELIIDHCPAQHLVGGLHEMTAIPVPGFAFQLHNSTVKDLSRHVYKVSSFFHKADIAHNLFINRGVVFGEERHSVNTTVRVFIWPRRKFIGTKSAEEFNVASIELAGHLPIREEKGYETLTEECVDAIIADSQLPHGHYEQLKQQLVEMFTPAHSLQES
ncbi:hypothetical protein C0Q70_13903 [Pomacea canaliculata]|uniref:GDP-D-glucose phosphorylase 1 n=2 Tax=Pomacea canaliculata TaxID=400727 RepID=A0A2T7NYM4_POMCA|nr:GDP-D-glucose phosphorylase 1-like isoform X2 [Pomacea canaliculata]PVD26233.1 hypothetical protein C0Q70_13903 [Pomacea canaliculata]